MKKNILLILLSMTLLLVGCTNKEKKEDKNVETNTKNENEDKNAVDEKSLKYVDNGGFYLNNKGEAVAKSEIQGKKIAEWYTEPICPFCVKLEDEVRPYLSEIQGENTLIKYMPLTFLGKKGNEGEVTYSDVITGVWLAMAENDPELVGKYYHETSSDEFLKSLQEVNNQNQIIEEAYTKKLEGKNWNKIVKDLPKFMEISKKTTERVSNDKELAKKTPKGSIT